MNEKQRKILLGTAFVVTLMVIFPPYIVENFRGVPLMAGYAFLLDLPSYITQSGSSIPASVNVKTQIVQIIGALTVGTLVFLSAK